MTSEDVLYMRRAVELAARGRSLVSPNPMVGAVIVKDGKIIAEGWHKKYGESHAERNAIDSLVDKSILKGSTMYVTLEPCCHHGKTPPCADYVIENGISKVYIGAPDPNPKVSGGGIKKLLDAGVEVYTDVLRDECEYVCRFFLTAQLKKRPYIMLKWAQSSDGYIGVKKRTSSQNVWFTGEDSRIKVHKMRATYDAIMVGTSTVLEDNPSLTVRAVDGKNPLRVTIDKNGILDPSLGIFSADSKTIVFSDLLSCSDNIYGDNVEIIKIDFSNDIIPQILSVLFERRIQSLMVEGGRMLLESFIRSDLYDEVNIFKTSRSLNDIYKDVDYLEVIPAPEVKYSKKTNIYFV